MQYFSMLSPGGHPSSLRQLFGSADQGSRWAFVQTTSAYVDGTAPLNAKNGIWPSPMSLNGWQRSRRGFFTGSLATNEMLHITGKIPSAKTFFLRMRCFTRIFDFCSVFDVLCVTASSSTSLANCMKSSWETL